MNDATLQKCIDQRTAVADEVLKQPWHFHVCDSCLAIVEREQPVCPHCHAYRFHADLLDVVFAARMILCTPYPRTEAVIPRF